ncbi:MAG: hypothetical protein JWR77_1524 [Rhizorhabdus sp.]|nr:hypothetical protein [Rhizorhabdus sp.]
MTKISSSRGPDRDISLRDLLRAETRADHDRVDAAFGSCDFARPDDYRRFLIAQAAAWQTLEPVLDKGSLDRLIAIGADLEVLGIAVPPPLDDYDLPDSMSLGMRYVLQGSRLGSTVLLRDLQAASPAMAQKASRYLVASAQLDEWCELSSKLQMRCVHDATETVMVEDARCTFGLFERAWRFTQPMAAARNDD